MTSQEHEPAIRRLCVVVDVERYSRNVGGVQQALAQEHLARVLTTAAEVSGIDRMEWIRQPAGDGELALLPPGIDEPEFVARFVRGLKAALFEHNHTRQPRLRLRVALDEGLVWMGAEGFAGDVVIDVSRLCDAAEVRRRLRESPNADLVLVISDSLYRDIRGYQYHDLPPHSFEPVTIDNPEKAFTARAHIHIEPSTSSGRPPTDSDPNPAGDPGPERGSPSVTQHGDGGRTNISYGPQKNIDGDNYEAARDMIFGQHPRQRRP